VFTHGTFEPSGIGASREAFEMPRARGRKPSSELLHENCPRYRSTVQTTVIHASRTEWRGLSPLVSRSFARGGHLMSPPQAHDNDEAVTIGNQPALKQVIAVRDRDSFSMNHT
jgi:hypothetical protein